MDISAVLLQTLIKELSSQVAKMISARASSHPKLAEGAVSVKHNLAAHLTRIANWSERVHFYGVSTATYADSGTIDLFFNAIERRFSVSVDSTHLLPESALLAEYRNLAILGAPGSGKTTTIKRLARRILVSPPLTEKDGVQCPVVVRLRDHDFQKKSLYDAIADELAIPYEYQRRTRLNRHAYDTCKREHFENLFELKRRLQDQEVLLEQRVRTEGSMFSGKMLKSEMENLRKNILELEKIGDSHFVEKAQETYEESYVGKDKLSLFLPDLLNSFECLLFLDGLDEVYLPVRGRIEQEIRRLAEELNSSRLIVSCRVGDFSGIDGFDTVTIHPLGEEKVHRIVELLLPDPRNFLTALQDVPYKDLADRPLFLTYLLAVYRNMGDLPTQPSDVYRRIIWLIIKEWDEQHDIRRASKYSGFYEERKLEFLAALAFQLTYQTGRASFSRKDLIRAFEEVKHSFGLVDSDLDSVISEVEAHTGLINKVGYENFEFSHTSLQEYLAATYLVRAPLSSALDEYIRSYPAPLAVAAAISSDPGEWIAGIVLRPVSATVERAAITSLLSRFQQERPLLSASPLLGYALLSILSRYGSEIMAIIEPILDLPNSGTAVCSALVQYQVVPRESFWTLEYSPYGDPEGRKLLNRLESLGLKPMREMKLVASIGIELLRRLGLYLEDTSIPTIKKVKVVS